MRNTHKQVDIEMSLYSKLLEYSKKNELKAPSATQGEHVLATITLLAKALPEK